MTERSRAVLYEHETVLMKTVRPPQKPEKAEKPQRTRQTGQGTGDADNGLFEALRQLRFRLAREQHVPAYVVFTDAALRDMSIRKPTDLLQFLEVNGVGQAKAEKYGSLFLEQIRSYIEQKEGESS